MRRSLTLLLGCVVCSTVACGGSVNSSTTTTSADGSLDGDAIVITGNDGAADGVTLGGDSTTTSGDSSSSGDVAAETTAPLSLDNVCDRYVAGVCTSDLQKCCTDRIHDYSAAGCKTAVNSLCGAAVAGVKAGASKWDPTKFDACMTAWANLNSSCSVFLFDFAKAYLPCEQLFPGTIALGSPCTTDGTCAVTDAYTYCDSTSHTCKQVRIQPIGGDCNYSDPTTVRLCDIGGYCPIAGGVCKTAKALGDACTVGMLECGFGHVCDAATSKCVKGLPATASCTSDLQCASWNCDKTTFKCTDPYVSPASSALCTGHP